MQLHCALGGNIGRGGIQEGINDIKQKMGNKNPHAYDNLVESPVPSHHIVENRERPGSFLGSTPFSYR